MASAAAVQPYGWISPPRSSLDASSSSPSRSLDKDFIEFEFRRIDDAEAKMLPADELFADGKLLPLCAPTPAPPHLPAVVPRRAVEAGAAPAASTAAACDVFSPKAPSCSSRWRELLGLKKTPSASPSLAVSRSLSADRPAAVRSLKFLMHRAANGRTASAAEPAMTTPLLGVDSAGAGIASARHSHSSSSSSSSSDLDVGAFAAPPRLSLDRPAPRLRLVRSVPDRRPQSPAQRSSQQSPSIDSPRMNACGKVIFQGLERSASSPAGVAGGKNRSAAAAAAGRIDRSYSVGVRVTPVLNVPVCSSLRGPGSAGFGFGPRRPVPGRTGAKGTGPVNAPIN